VNAGTLAPRTVDAYRYDLPRERIALAPAEPADAARLLLVGTGSGPAALEDRVFRDLAEVLQPGDVLVINETRVLRARLHGTREPGGGTVEVLLLRPADGGGYDPAARRWHVLVRPGRRLTPGVRIRFDDRASALVTAVREEGSREIELALGDDDLETFLARCGSLPLPPYVGRSEEAEDPRAARYQTIFARVPGSVAAPTASLHFTPRGLAAIRARGVTVAPLVLDVGIGTFKPMQGAAIDDHVMHAEPYEIPQATAAAVTAAIAEGRRVVVAGTTALRALEASALAHGSVRAGAGRAELFITPGFRFRTADVLLTNFHLPASTLLVLVAAFAGYDRAMRAYAHAIAHGYRFFSFGDAMLIARAGGTV